MILNNINKIKTGWQIGYQLALFDFLYRQQAYIVLKKCVQHVPNLPEKPYTKSSTTVNPQNAKRCQKMEPPKQLFVSFHFSTLQIENKSISMVNY